LLHLGGQSPGELLIEDEHLPDEDGNGPPIQQDVVVAEDEAVRRILRAQQRETDQRRRGQLEAPAAVGVQPLVEARLLLRGRQPAPVLLDERQFHLTRHHLEGRIDALPDGGRPEDGVCLHHLSPGLQEGGEVQAPAQLAGELVEIHPAALLEDMEEHALLERRERVQVLEASPASHQRIQRLLPQPRQREVGWREDARRILRRDTPQQGPQRLQEASRQRLQRLPPVHLRPVRPGHLEASSGDDGVDADPVGAPGERLLGGSRGLRGQDER
jgi:hypothetical protein